ncbi:RmlC-like cupin domain-containing protein [Corynascus novoguineensis]|uniref:RmlC-like cupin domain-containing protein n=1 Tax=Corynascus novoguineensis TaxID=1126955 RepID=A0AAN7HQQ7_9PEZI|nr:RmlC-like cupin domain-containing protein [Corynascus novoguineensis]
MHPRNTNHSSDPPNPNPLPFVKPSIAAAPSSPPGNEPSHIQSLITRLRLQPHAEGGYFAEAHRDPKLTPSPYPSYPASPSQWAAATTNQQKDKKGGESGGFNPAVRNASTIMFYLLTPGSPVGFLHRNRGPTVHTLLRGRGRYVVIHERVRIESFVAGLDRARGEKQRWVVEGGKYKATFLLPDLDESGEEGSTSKEGMLVAETVVPGFEFFDHEFLEPSGLEELVGKDWAEKLGWLVKRQE